MDGLAEHGEFVEVEDEDIAWVFIFEDVTVGLSAPPVGCDFGEVCGVGEQFVHAVDDKVGASSELWFGECFDDDFGADAAGVTHCDTDGGLGGRWVVMVFGHWLSYAGPVVIHSVMNWNQLMIIFSRRVGREERSLCPSAVMSTSFSSRTPPRPSK